MRRGVSMSLTEFANLRQFMSEIVAELSKMKSEGESEANDYRKHLGAGIYVTIRQHRSGVDLRHFFHPSDSPEPVPTKRGIYISKAEMSHFQEAIAEIALEYPQFGSAEGNICSGIHYDPRTKSNCKYCKPFGLIKVKSKEEVEAEQDDTNEPEAYSPNN